MEDPGPEGFLADPHAGLVRRNRRAGQQLLADPVGLSLERRRRVLHHVG